MNTKLFCLLAAGGLLAFAFPYTSTFDQNPADPATVAATVTITDGDLLPGSTYNWSSDTTYILDGLVYLEEGGLLNINPGTIIKGRTNPSNGDPTSALIIARGAQIFAEGGPDAPIIFTAESDDTEDPSDLSANLDKGLWGGLVILGGGSIAHPDGEATVPGFPAEESLAVYGGAGELPPSGNLQFVSIRHGGADYFAANESAGLFLGGVTDGSFIVDVEVIASGDDGIVINGGDVDLKYISVSFCEDDQFDIDEGWIGQGQFWFTLQDDVNDGGLAMEIDGEAPGSESPWSQPTIYNATFVGQGVGSEGETEYALGFRDRAGGFINHSIVIDFPQKAVFMEDIPDTDFDSYNNFTKDALIFSDNIWFAFGTEGGFGDLIDQGTSDVIIPKMIADSNSIVDPLLTNISRIPGGNLDPRPQPGSPALNVDQVFFENVFFDDMDYKGAFDGNSRWIENWTALQEYGYLNSENVETPISPAGCESVISVYDTSLLAGGDYVWTAENCYVLEEMVYLEAGGSLTIEAGTHIYGRGPRNDNGLTSSALIITRGATIQALGDSAAPIIFTSVFDSLTTETDALDVNLEERHWGGLIVLGQGPVTSRIDYPYQAFYEPLDDSEFRHEYGGVDSLDDSGVLRHISIRHAGILSSGLVLAGVGRGTVIDHVEVVASGNGLEVLGGTVNLKHVVSAFHSRTPFWLGDGWNGKGQYWFGLQKAEAMIELSDSLTRPIISNSTFIGPEIDSISPPDTTGMLVYEGDAGGLFFDCIFTESNGYGLKINNTSLGSNSLHQLVAGDIQSKSNMWHKFLQGEEFDGGGNSIIGMSGNVDGTAEQRFADSLFFNGNLAANPLLVGISRIPDGGLDPRPRGSNAYYNFALRGLPYADLDSVNHKGAFGPLPQLWPLNWTFLDQAGYFSSPGDTVKVVDNLPDEVKDKSEYSSKTIIVSYPDDVTAAEIHEAELYYEGQGLMKQGDCRYFDDLPHIQLWGADQAIGLDAPITGGNSRIDVDTIELNFDLILNPAPAIDEETHCVMPSAQTEKTKTAVIALVDSGADLLDPSIGRTDGNELLAGIQFLKSTESFIGPPSDNDGNGWPNDLAGFDLVRDTHLVKDNDGHGSHIGGIIADRIPADVDLQILNLKVYDQGDGGLFNVICSIHEAIDNDVDLISLSLGYFAKEPSIALYRALQLAREAGIPVIISAGNENEDLDAEPPSGTAKLFRWPGHYKLLDTLGYRPLDNLMIVAALDFDEDAVDPRFTNYGHETVDIAARGTSVISATKVDLVSANRAPLDTLSGSSMSVGFVSNLVAIIRAYRPDLPYDKIFQAIRSNADSINTHSKPIVGGKLNVEETLQSLDIVIDEALLPKERPCSCYDQYGQFRDQDEDGVSDCYDRCPGDDFLDLNKDGIPDACQDLDCDPTRYPYVNNMQIPPSENCRYVFTSMSLSSLTQPSFCLEAISPGPFAEMNFRFTAPPSGEVEVYLNSAEIFQNTFTRIDFAVFKPGQTVAHYCHRDPWPNLRDPIYRIISDLDPSEEYTLRVVFPKGNAANSQLEIRVRPL